MKLGLMTFVCANKGWIFPLRSIYPSITVPGIQSLSTLTRLSR